MKAAAVSVPVLVVLTGLLVTRCVAVGPETHSAAAQGPAPVAAASTGSYNATDVAWLQLMIPMTEQALRLLDAVPGRTADPELTRLAAEISEAHRVS